MSISDAIAGLAALISGWSAWKTYTYGQTQNKLNELLLNEKLGHMEHNKKANFRSVFQMRSSNTAQVDLINTGAADATNVRIHVSVPDFIVPSELNQKFPAKKMEPGDTISMLATPYLAHGSEIMATVFWSDAYSDDNEKTLDLKSRM